MTSVKTLPTTFLTSIISASKQEMLPCILSYYKCSFVCLTKFSQKWQWTVILASVGPGNFWLRNLLHYSERIKTSAHANIHPTDSEVCGAEVMHSYSCRSLCASP